VRACFHLKKHTNWSDINPELFQQQPELSAKLTQVYGNVDNVDLYIGGMLESKDGPGELFNAIIIDQFTRLRDSDRFWFENTANG
jgi:dual oxidase